MANATYEIPGKDATNPSKVAKADMKFEVVILPVSDVDRAKAFYQRLGWRLDADFAHGDDWRGVNSRRRAPGARSSSARMLPLRRRAPPRACT